MMETRTFFFQGQDAKQNGCWKGIHFYYVPILFLSWRANFRDKGGETYVKDKKAGSKWEEESYEKASPEGDKEGKGKLK